MNKDKIQTNLLVAVCVFKIQGPSGPLFLYGEIICVYLKDGEPKYSVNVISAAESDQRCSPDYQRGKEQGVDKMAKIWEIEPNTITCIKHLS